MYPGDKYTAKANNMWDENLAETYFNIIQKYHDKIIIEVGAHDHFSDVRYHSS